MSKTAILRNAPHDAIGLLRANLKPSWPVTKTVRLGNLSRLIPVIRRNIAGEVATLKQWRRAIEPGAGFWKDEAVVDFLKTHKAIAAALSKAEAMVAA